MATKFKKITVEKDLFEKKAWKQRLFIVGVDEVGRGCLAGPVLAAAVVLPLDCDNQLLKDSKVMTPAARDRAYEWIMQNAWVGVGITDQETIDQVNIYQATIMSMKKAVHNLYAKHPELPLAGIVVDAVPLTFTHPGLAAVTVDSFIKGEACSKSIAAASIVAKVVRDRLMNSFDTVLKGYDFKSHKGYGTAKHQQSILAHGESIIHRKTFLTKLLTQPEPYGTQQTLF